MSAGHSIHERLFTVAEVGQILDALANPNILRSRAGARHLLSVPGVSEIAANRRLLNLAASFVGRGAIPFRATLFEKSIAANWLVGWHQDTALPLCHRVDDLAWGPWSMKEGVLYAHAPASALDRVVALRVHLDDSTESNGPLRVLPDTHRQGVLTEAEIQRLVQTIRAVPLLAPAGSVVAMRPLIVHASSKAQFDRPRRVLHIEYAEALVIEAGVELTIT